uniref:Uncharacterized protein n=1 Tax=Anguilla anguilla TaxID=7936 RepID=A0A0E9QDR7_ANGAN
MLRLGKTLSLFLCGLPPGTLSSSHSPVIGHLPSLQTVPGLTITNQGLLLPFEL